MTGYKPILRYHGGKSVLGPWLLDHFPAHRIYVEPFAGSASVLLRKRRVYSECINDLNAGVVNLFTVLRDPVLSGELERVTRLTPFSRDEFKAAHVAATDPVERARRFVIRSYMGFGSNSTSMASGFRSCSNLSGSTPAHDWSRWPDRIAYATDRLRGVVIENRDACDVMLAHDGPETLHYCDPPYVLDTRTASNGYEHDFTNADHERLAECLHGLDGMVVLSGYPSALYDRLFGGWKRIERDALADGAKPRREVLWLNTTASSALEREAMPLLEKLL